VGGDRDLLIFIPNRTSPTPDSRDFRFRNSHIRIGVTFKQSFGGAPADQH
jgi:hypothetical protein